MNIFIIISLIPISLYLLYRFYVKLVFYPTIPGIPGVPLYRTSLLLRNYGNILRNIHRIHDFKYELYKELKEDASITGNKELQQRHAPFVRAIEILSPRILEYMLKENFNNFEKGQRFHDIFVELLGDGIFNVDGSLWKSQRKVASHLFSAKKLNQFMLKVFVDHAHVFIEVLNKHIEQQPDQYIDLQSLFFQYTFESICKIAFGLHIDVLQSKTPHPFTTAFDICQEIAAHRFFSIGGFYKVKRYFNCGSEKNLRKHVKIINDFVYEIVKARKENMELYADSSDLLSLFLHDAAKRGEVLSDKYIRDIIINFMVAGRDTTACALSWMFYMLCQHPECMNKMREEGAHKMNSVSSNDDLEVTDSNVKELIYSEACFLEAVRLYGPVAGDSKVSINECTLPNGVVLPPKSLMIYSPYTFGRMEDIWGPDALEYKPERWIVHDDEGKMKILQPSQYEFIAFNAGLRLCLGKSMAIMEGKTLASMLLQHFNFELKPNLKPDYRVSVTLSMLHGCPVKVTKRTIE